MSLTFVQILITAYRDNFQLGQFSLSDNNDGNGPFISSWNVPNISQPTYEEVMQLDTPTLESLFNFYTFVDEGTPLLAAYIDNVAQQKQYKDAVSCASYINSTNTTWKGQATSFITWRDLVYNYVLAQETLMQNGFEPFLHLLSFKQNYQ